MKEIRYVKQPNAYWCGQACVAMLAGVPVEEVVSVMGNDKGTGKKDIARALDTLLCRWFRVAVLPLDKQLEGEILYSKDMKPCAICGKTFLPGSNRAKYCTDCANRVERYHATQRKRNQRRKCHDLESRESL